MTTHKIIHRHQRIPVTSTKTVTIEDNFVALITLDYRNHTPSRFVFPTNMYHAHRLTAIRRKCKFAPIQIIPLCRSHEGVRGGGSCLPPQSPCGSPPLFFQTPTGGAV
ncbi:hypothetical protein [Pseudochrobactrum sp. HB0163]|uniref:hypothetical protein n=1 Tax=Pseudochrobactrum sp. HB0163 TaxID=3450708 RepID=UPI003F6E1ACC